MPTPNEHKLKIALTNSSRQTVVDAEDFGKASPFTWRLNNTGHVITGNPRRGTFQFLHHIVLPPKAGFVTDHADQNKLNNTRSNLRYATKQQNSANSKLRSDSISGYRGVSWFKRSGKWLASIRVSGRTKNLGYYNDKAEAARAYDAAAEKHFGEFATLNFPRAQALAKVKGVEV